MDEQQLYMHRCLQLAAQGMGYTAPNPMVGAVLVYNNKIIGEGYHEKYGGPHAEVNCLHAVREEDRKLIPLSTLYVSLEPCAHFGKTPPCADLIIKNQIKKVVVGVRDPFEQVAGKGIEKLQQAGVEVTQHVLEQACTKLNKRFFTFHLQKRPFIILKWAQSADGFMSAADNSRRTLISNAFSNSLVHRWRGEEAAIMVGTQTALLDNPSLTNRLWKGKQPTRVLLDRQLKVPATFQLFDQTVATLVFNDLKQEQQDNLHYYQLNKDADVLLQIMDVLYKQGLNSLLVEGGRQLLQSFIDKGLWDEARMITNTKMQINEGVYAPALKDAVQQPAFQLDNDTISIFSRAS